MIRVSLQTRSRFCWANNRLTVNNCMDKAVSCPSKGANGSFLLCKGVLMRGVYSLSNRLGYTIMSKDIWADIHNRMDRTRVVRIEGGALP